MTLQDSQPAAAGDVGVSAKYRALRAALPITLFLAPAIFFLVTILLPPLNHDVAAVLDFSRRWLGGERLYVDLVDVNPPRIFMLNLVPAAIARCSPPRSRATGVHGSCGACWSPAPRWSRGLPSACCGSRAHRRESCRERQPCLRASNTLNAASAKK